jgi:hypothetical protein
LSWPSWVWLPGLATVTVLVTVLAVVLPSAGEISQQERRV